MSFLQKVVIVTGSSSGIGAATAELFSRRGAEVVLVGRNKTKLKNVAEKCSKVGPAPLVLTADVGKESDAELIINETIKKYGKLDVLVNNAGAFVDGSVLKGDLLKAYDDTMEVNVRAVIKLTLLATPYLIKSKGNIVNISSVEAKRASMQTHLSYGVSKAALDHFSRGAALELAAEGVRVNLISPGPVRTDALEISSLNHLTWDDIGKTMPLKRVSEPEEIAEVVLFLASEKAKGITGSDFFCDNGDFLGANEFAK